MSIMFAALNPNLTSSQLAELIEHNMQCNERLFETFKTNLDSLKTAEEKDWYMQTCLPVLMNILLF